MQHKSLVFLWSVVLKFSPYIEKLPLPPRHHQDDELFFWATRDHDLNLHLPLEYWEEFGIPRQSQVETHTAFHLMYSDSTLFASECLLATYSTSSRSWGMNPASARLWGMNPAPGWGWWRMLCHVLGPS